MAESHTKIVDDLRFWISVASDLQDRYRHEGDAYKTENCEIALASAARVTVRRLERLEQKAPTHTTGK